MKIGTIDFCEKPVFLAPMEDITDPSFRYMCKQYGADMMYTEFISSDGLIRDGAKSVAKLNIFDYERPIGIQIYGHLTEAMVEAAKIAESAKPDLIDINFGCPVKKIANRGAGSGMMRDVPKMVEITDAVVKAVNLPVTVKTRLGWDSENLNIPEIAEKLQDVGISALTIHGRTRCQLYKGNADWTLIGQVKNNPRIKIPIIGNGDITSPEIALQRFNETGVDAIMVGRATIGRPWIFHEIKHFLKTGVHTEKMSIPAVVDMAKNHFIKSLEIKNNKRGLYEMRRHFSLYFKGLPHFKDIRLKLVTSSDPDEINQLLDLVAEKYSDFQV